MIVVDPSKRCDLSKVLMNTNPKKLFHYIIIQVLEIYALYKESQKDGLSVDPILIMEDISEKLNLLDYQKYCIQKSKKPIHKLYFAFLEPGSKSHDKFMTFIEISYWILGLIQVSEYYFINVINSLIIKLVKIERKTKE